jgi:hypothetical protein
MLLAAGAATALLGHAPSAHAWGATGHRLIGQLGVASLPAGLPAFLYTPDAVEAVGELAREPDRWKGSGKIHDSTRDPAHFTDAGKILGGPPLNALPPTRADFDMALRAVNSDGFHAGYLPYSIVDGWQQLTRDFTYWRVETAAIAREHNPDHKAWMERDLKRRETLTLADLGEWAHYVGDGSQPMHVSVHFNGWGPYPNPNGYTQDKVHAYFEGQFVRQSVTYEGVRAAMAPPQTCAAPIEICVADYLAATEATVEPYYALQKAGGFVDADPRGVAFATQRIAAAASEVRDLTLAAWQASATSNCGYPPITLDQVVAGTVDAYQSLFAED